MDKVRVGLVGVGGMGGCHFFNYADIKNAELVAVCPLYHADPHFRHCHD